MIKPERGQEEMVQQGKVQNSLEAYGANSRKKKKKVRSLKTRDRETKKAGKPEHAPGEKTKKHKKYSTFHVQWGLQVRTMDDK